MDVETWLGSLGLGQYETLFQKNQIEADALVQLTDQFLKDVGVPLGHRLRMLRAIRELGARAPRATAPTMSDRAARDGAERRHMTVMFYDQVGLSALTAQLD